MAPYLGGAIADRNRKKHGKGQLKKPEGPDYMESSKESESSIELPKPGI